MFIACNFGEQEIWHNQVIQELKIQNGAIERKKNVSTLHLFQLKCNSITNLIN